MNSNPDNIIMGLSEAIKRYFNVDFSSQKVALPSGYTLMNGQVIKYNNERNDIYFGEDFYAVRGIIYPLDKGTEVMMDYFVYDMHSKTFKNPLNVDDGFIDAFNEQVKDKKVHIVLNEVGNQCVLANGVQILEIKEGQIVKVNFPDVTEIKHHFLCLDTTVESFSADNAKLFGESLLYNNKILKSFSAEKAEIFGRNGLCFNQGLRTLKLDNCKTFCGGFMSESKALEIFSAEKVERFTGDFLYNNASLKVFNVKKGAIFNEDVLGTHPNREQLMNPEKPTTPTKSAINDIVLNKIQLTR